MRTLYVGGLSPETDSEALRRLFAEFGQLRAARVVMRPSTRLCRGFGYVTFERSEDARRAQRALDGCDFEEGRLRVASAS